jgi:hypothetical protein
MLDRMGLSIKNAPSAPDASPADSKKIRHDFEDLKKKCFWTYVDFLY